MDDKGFISLWSLIIMSALLVSAVTIHRFVVLQHQMVVDEMRMVRADYMGQRGLQWISYYVQGGHTIHADFGAIVLEDSPTHKVEVRLEQKETTYLVGVGTDKEHHLVAKHGFKGTTYTTGNVLLNKGYF